MGKKEFLEMYNDKRQKMQIWTRCMGYYRNTESFNTGKQSEFKQRVFFEIKEIIN